MRRCSKCLLPENYPRIKFNIDNICNFCENYNDLDYRGLDALKSEIQSYLGTYRDRNQKYDCVFALSGGRDSSFLLYKLVKETNFKFAAYCADHGFLPEETKENIKNLTEELDVDLIIEEHTFLTKSVKHHIQSWMKNPHPAMVGLFCTGCKLGIDLGLSNFAKKHNIPVIITGATPFEGQGYKKNLLKKNPEKGMSSFIYGYVSRIAENPSWILNPGCVSVQLKEFHYHYMEKWKDSNHLVLYPFGSFIKWNESEVISTLNEIGWKKTENAKSTWRGDCQISLLKLFLYKESLGFNDRDDGLSCLVRDGQLTRKAALERLNSEGSISLDTVMEIIDEMGIDSSEFKIALEKSKNYIE
ncbi:hypothetical protein RE474_01520 [Methanolobus sediminis]|uniref:N-acetyl sugar amidotransferase n=1 Tax=Methanolobus sediminis TaxID=3072978 RepID=A0AA51ULE9_9EURY|nr:hypothetical protein [Methanolobus sediminis]WMW25427.1 hypothetical protein RE474_01520 [Methanolobus sediminis]